MAYLLKRSCGRERTEIFGIAGTDVVEFWDGLESDAHSLASPIIADKNTTKLRPIAGTQTCAPQLLRMKRLSLVQTEVLCNSDPGLGNGSRGYSD